MHQELVNADGEIMCDSAHKQKVAKICRGHVVELMSVSKYLFTQDHR